MSHAVVAGILLGPAPAVHAATTTTTMAVSATVLSFCSVSALPLAFGNYSGALLSASTTVSVTCTLGTTFNLGIDAGLGSGATVAARQMTFGGNTLTYGLYSNAGATTVIGTSIGTNTISSTGTGSSQSITVYGQVPAGQAVAPGLYTDTVTVTITY
ncbi:spore coat U domain-containing protein [Paeniroseomonas aquatica]|uniref:Spore coat U domain-containing protein n=1 Tax=Paeniroseomonas aquatica TaxID=373043 RepID=A0ABT8A6K4_9PROT|nr:spore coat U domain-containing protein [Paeniroseomonas aquatica]MDN3565354.1 spore coat U domain-containing protein [Paeniroseomonas aquatica]